MEIFLRPLERAFSLAIAPFDEFSGRFTAGKHIRMMIDGPFPPPLVKPEGFYVFYNLPDGQYRISVDSDRYFSQILTVEKQSSPHFCRLIPNRRYPLAKGDTWIEGYVRPDTLYYLLSEHLTGRRLLRLKGNRIHLPGALPWDLTHRLVAVGKSCEIRMVCERLDGYTYRLDAPPSVPEDPCDVRPISVGRSDREGYLFCPLGALLPGQESIRLLPEGEPEQAVSYAIRQGCGNILY